MGSSRLAKWLIDDFVSLPSVIFIVLVLALALLLRGCKMAAVAPGIFPLHNHVQGKNWGRDSDWKLSFLSFYQEAKHFPEVPK